MKRLSLSIGALAVLSVSLCGIGAGTPAMAAWHDASTLSAVQPATMIPIGAMPVWGWLILLPSLAIILLLCAAPIIMASASEEEACL